MNTLSSYPIESAGGCLWESKNENEITIKVNALKDYDKIALQCFPWLVRFSIYVEQEPIMQHKQWQAETPLAINDWQNFKIPSYLTSPA